MSLTKATYSMISGSVINVFDYGAKGDGSTDDTAAIQAAFNAGANGGYVYFPKGNYYVTSSLTYYGSFGGESGLVTDNASQTPLYGTWLTFNTTTAASCLIAGAQYYGIVIKNIGVNIAGKSECGLDIKYGGNQCQYERIRITATDNSSSASNRYGIYLRGVNPDTGVSNYHQHDNVFLNVQVDGHAACGIKLGDNKDGDSIANGNVLIEFVEYLSVAYSKAIYLNGYGSSIYHPSIGGGSAAIYFYGQCGNNAICGGYFDSALSTAIYVQANVGQRFVFNAFGCQGLTKTKIVDTIEPTVATRFVVVGEYSYIPTPVVSQISSWDGTSKIQLLSNAILAQLAFVPDNPGAVSNNTIYVSQFDGKIYFKDGSGVDHALY